MSLRVGIVSPFCENYNYGGKLQAYALTAFLRGRGYAARQIQYRQHGGSPVPPAGGGAGRLLADSDYRRAVGQKLLGKCLPGGKRRLAVRKAAFDRFDGRIPHTEQIYSDADIAAVCGDFDVFITGSDQVWNPGLLKRGYFLDFAGPEKYRFSYAASGAGSLPPGCRAYFQSALAGFDGVSVREEDGQAVLSRLLRRPVALCVDPVFLPGREAWRAVSEDIPVEPPYLLCYFLGYDRAERRAARAFAAQKGLKIVTLPQLLAAAGRYYGCDLGFGDMPLYDVTPGQFVRLIENAAYVMTDSFHAAALSIVFQKRFIVFGRAGNSAMDSRIAGLLSMFGLESRRADGGDIHAACDILSRPIAYGPAPGFEARRRDSVSYLRQNLSAAEARLANR